MRASYLIMNLASIINSHGDIEVKIEHIESDGSQTNIECVSLDDNNCIILEIV